MRTGRSSPSVEQRSNLVADTPKNAVQGDTDPDPQPRPNNVSVVGAGRPFKRSGRSARHSVAGFILMDSALNPILMNTEAEQILNYPDRFVKDDHVVLCAAIKIRSYSRTPLSDELPFVTEFRSGRRRYYCRAFVVDSNVKDPSDPRVAVLFERGPSALTSLSRVSLRFNLTPREEEALEYLLQGLSSKEIANRMGISLNTVKVFLRLLMTKLGVSSRSAIAAKILMIRQQ